MNNASAKNKARAGLLTLLYVFSALLCTLFFASPFGARADGAEITTAADFMQKISSLKSTSVEEITLGADITLTEQVNLYGTVTIKAQSRAMVALDGDAFLDIKNGTSVVFENITFVQTAGNTKNYAALFRSNSKGGKAVFYNCTVRSEKSTASVLKATEGDACFYLDNTVVTGGAVAVDGGTLMLSGESETSALSADTVVNDFTKAEIVETVKDGCVHLSCPTAPVGYMGQTPEKTTRINADIYYTLDGSIPAFSSTRMRYDDTQPISLVVDRNIKASLVGQAYVYSAGYAAFYHDVIADKTPGTLSEVLPVEAKQYRCASAVSLADFPEAVAVKLTDGRTVYVLADWDISGIHTNLAGEYEAVAQLRLPAFITDTTNAKATVKVTVYYADIEDFDIETSDPMQEAKTTAAKGYTVGTFSARGGNEKDYTYTLVEGAQNFTIAGSALRLARRLTAGDYQAVVKVESAGKTAQKTFAFNVQAKSYVKVISANPYEGIDWETVNFISTAPHNHTYYSSGAFEESEHNDVASGTVSGRIEKYKSYGYGAVIITEHDYVTMEKEPSAFEQGGVLSLYGNELSKSYHTLYYGLTPYYDRKGAGSGVSNGVPGNLAKIRELNGKGFAYFGHPYRSRRDNDYWLNLFDEYQDVVYGMEVFNAGQPSRNFSEPLWDYILTQRMPARAIWGSASDDAHSDAATGTGWMVMLLSDENMNSNGLFGALKNGASFLSTICIDPETDSDLTINTVRGPIPYFTSVTVNEGAGTVTATAENYTRIEWVSANGRVVGTSPTLNLNTAYGVDKYVRCRIYGLGGMSHCQPLAVSDGDKLYEGTGEDPADNPTPDAPTTGEPTTGEPTTGDPSTDNGKGKKKGCGGCGSAASAELGIVVPLLLTAAFVAIRRTKKTNG